MCSEPVTFGGGITMEKGSAPGPALAPALKAPASSQSREMRASASAAPKVLSIAIASASVRGAGERDDRVRPCLSGARG
jgi:hypothetical protein